MIEIEDPKAKQIVLGIDLGTTHTVCSALIDAKMQIMNPDAPLIPSIVEITDDGIKAGLNASINCIRNIKSLMGSNQKVQDLSPEYISAHILKHAVESAKTYYKAQIKQAVITVPAYFDEAARLATKQAAQMIGLDVLRLINEPTAAALAYGIENNNAGKYVVYDLGGGTFDVSILHLQDGVFQVLGIGGNRHLGGEDFDKIIVDYWRADSKEQPEDRMIARRAKEYLSKQSHGVWELNGLGTVALNQQTLNLLLAPFIEQTIDILRQTILRAELTAADLAGVILVGGSTRIPLIKERLMALFPNCAIFCDLDPDTVVAIGAAYHGAHLSGKGTGLLLDVLPISLGIETYGGINEKIITRNTPIPCKASQEFTTYEDNQTAISIHVVQGERELVANCLSLAKFTLSDIPLLPAGKAKVEIEFNIDANGLLTVHALEKNTHAVQSLQVNYSKDHQEDIANDDLYKRVFIETKLKAEKLCKNIKTILTQEKEFISHKELQAIESAIASLQDAMGKESKDLLEQNMANLEKTAYNVAKTSLQRNLTSTLKL